MNLIGGEFEVDPSLLLKKNKTKLNFDNLFPFGRAALYYIFKVIKKKNNNIRILLPDYLCKSIVKTIEDIQLKFSFYPVDKKLHLDRAYFEKMAKRKTSHKIGILIINYFGLLSLNEDVRFIKNINRDWIVIIDNVQAFFEMNRKIEADFIFTSFRKSLPVPDGGYVKCHRDWTFPVKRKNNINISSLYKMIGGLLKYLKNYEEIDDKVFLKFLEKGEKFLNNEEIYNSRISEMTLTILKNLDYKKIGAIRVKNFNYLKNRLSKIGISPLIEIEEGKIPLFFPIVIHNRNEVRSKLFKESIFCPVHWPICREYEGELRTGKFLSKNELSLVIDQRYSKNDMERISDILEKSNVELVNY